MSKSQLKPGDLVEVINSNSKFDGKIGKIEHQGWGSQLIYKSFAVTIDGRCWDIGEEYLNKIENNK